MRTECRACHQGTVQVFLDLGKTPLADAFQSAPIRTPCYPLKIGVCTRCWLVQLLEESTVSDELLFGSGYAFFSSSSPTLQTHFRQLSEYVMKNYPAQCEAGVLEIACNDGSLLRHFDTAGYPAAGVDPAGPPTALAREKGLNVDTGSFEYLGGEKLGIVLALNVLAHVRDPVKFLMDIARTLAWDGVAILEFQYLPDLLMRNDWSLFYHEHRSHLSLTSLRKMAQLAGLSISRATHIDTQGGSLRVELGHAGSRPSIGAPSGEAWIRNLATYESVQGRVDYSADRLREVLLQYDHVAAYGASAKLTTLIHYAELQDDLRYVLDLTPHKIGRFVPGTSIPVISDLMVSNGDFLEAEAYLLSIPNYLPQVLRRERAFLDRGGKFIVPFPSVEVF